MPTCRPRASTASATDGPWASEMATTAPHRRVRLGLVGGGRGALIGPVQRKAARLDDRFEIRGAVLSSDPAKALADAKALGLSGFVSLGAMIEAGGLDAVAIATPNNSHARLCLEALDAGPTSSATSPSPTRWRMAGGSPSGWRPPASSSA